VTTDNTTDIPHPGTETQTLALWVGGAGNVKVDLSSGTTVTITAVSAGTELKIQATRVYATGTTATSIVALH